MPGLPQLAFLLSIGGLGVSLAGFSGLVSALKRGAALDPIDTYRLRQIPEMALATGFLALLTVALADTTGDATTTIRIAGGLGLLFTIAHVLVLIDRARAMGIQLTKINVATAGVLDVSTAAVGVTVLVSPTAGAYEWLLALMLGRSLLAFLLALSNVSGG